MPISPTRLVLARKLRGVTLAELGRITTLSTQTINRYENGRQEPTDDSLEKLSEALELPVDFFFGPEIDPVPVEAVSFRALSKTPAFRRDAVMAATEIATQISDWIAERYHLPEVDVPSYWVDSETLGPEDVALKVRANWGLGSHPIPNMVHLLEAHGIRVFSLARQVREIDAFCFFRNGIPFIFIDTGKTAERQRFDAAHELGHLVMHQGSERLQGREIERQADRFAAALLMPRNDVLARKLRNASVGRIVQEQRRWGVAAMALTHRLFELGQLTEWGYRSCCIELSKRGFRNSEPGSSLVPESSQVFAKVFSHLRGSRSGVKEIIKDLHITTEEFNRHVFSLATTVHGGVPTNTLVKRREHLQVM